MQERGESIDLKINLLDQQSDQLRSDTMKWESVEVGAMTTWYNVQDQLREKVGPGDLLMGNEQVQIGERGEKELLLIGNLKVATTKRILGNIGIAHIGAISPKEATSKLALYAKQLKVAFKLAQ
jgi:hypothetical protein